MPRTFTRQFGRQVPLDVAHDHQVWGGWHDHTCDDCQHVYACDVAHGPQPPRRTRCEACWDVYETRHP